MTDNVILYSTGCPKCKVLKMKMNAKGIQYTENNSVDEMLELGIKSAPTLSVNGQMMDYMSALTYVKEK